MEETKGTEGLEETKGTEGKEREGKEAMERKMEGEKTKRPASAGAFRKGRPPDQINGLQNQRFLPRSAERMQPLITVIKDIVLRYTEYLFIKNKKEEEEVDLLTTTRLRHASCSENLKKLEIFHQRLNLEFLRLF